MEKRIEELACQVLTGKRIEVEKTIIRKSLRTKQKLNNSKTVKS